MPNLGLYAAFLLLACRGIAAGGEEYGYMPMRGNRGEEEDGAKYNDFRAERLPASLTEGEADSASPANRSGPASEMGMRFLPWKNHCAVYPPGMESRSPTPAGTPGFLLVSPYVARPMAEPGGFFEALGLKIHG